MEPIREIHIEALIGKEIQAQTWQVERAVELLDQGATVPFIARYRKEVTGSLDDTQLRTLEERLKYYRMLVERRQSILSSIEKQGKLTPELEQQIMEAETVQRLEDLYAPYKPKRMTRAQMAREAGLEPLATLLFTQPQRVPEQEAQAYVQSEGRFNSLDAVLDGVRDILAEQFSEDADLVGKLREQLWTRGFLVSHVLEGKELEGIKFKDYFDYSECISHIPSHRALAMIRGMKADILGLSLQAEEDPEVGLEEVVQDHFQLKDLGRAGDAFLLKCARWAWRVKLQPSLETELINRLRELSEDRAIEVFGTNLKALLLAAPAGAKVVMGLDPGIRTGVKVAVVGKEAQLLTTAVVYPFEPHMKRREALVSLAKLIQQHQVEMIAIGNGTASRETDALARELVKLMPERELIAVVVSEAGASVYSASELAAAEFPDIDVSYRGAISIARRLQDPLAELVKIEPKSIGVGQYQHDVDQNKLGERLDVVVEDCVNSVGVDINTASAELLRRVVGLGRSRAKRIVEYRQTHGLFGSRDDIMNVPTVGKLSWEQAVGFLRIHQGKNALDATAVHPESYPVVEQIAHSLNTTVEDLIGNIDLLKRVELRHFVSEKVGMPTLVDILRELEKPGRDPRPEFHYAQFDESVHDMTDLRAGMMLEGRVTNVAQFGAFVDIGVHQDALVHLSELSDRFVKDPHEVVKVGDVVKVRILDVDLQRKRIAASMKSEGGKNSSSGSSHKDGGARSFGKSHRTSSVEKPLGAMAQALMKLKR